MNKKLFKIRFTSPLHMGNHRGDYDKSESTVASDTLYSALLSCIAKIGVVDIAEKGDLGCSISSLFPYYQSNDSDKTTYFLPKAAGIALDYSFDMDKSKKVKKVDWLDTGYFQRMVQGKSVIGQGDDSALQGIFLTNSSDFDPDFMQTELQLRIKGPRFVGKESSENAEPFYMERIHFREKSGLYFLAIGDTDILEAGLDVLKEEGLGTDRTVGNGRFEWTGDEWPKIEWPKASTGMNLSLFCPQPSEVPELLNGDNLAYEVTRRGGWLSEYQGWRKNSVYMFKEGSVLNHGQEFSHPKIMGQFKNLAPQSLNLGHPVWRNGRSIIVPIKQNR